MHIKKGDNIIVKIGKYAGKKGKVMKVMPKENRAIVEGVNIYKKHQKPKRSNEKGSIVDVTRSVHISNLQVVDPKGGKGTRIGSKMIGDKKVRIAKGSGSEIA